MLLEQYLLVIFVVTYFTYALTIGFVIILFFEACLQKAAWYAGFIKRFNLNWQTELLKVL
jgi:hypothetical protein